ncbi:MAG TPA: hypothetical protein VFU55_01990 [Terracidiphilus sp.]|nr:hypothetical protein [Terracidiphilus sp.]
MSRGWKLTAALAAACALAGMSGCSLWPTTRHLPKPRIPLVTRTVTPAELVEQMNVRWAALDGLTATVEMQATEMKTKEGIAKDFPSGKGYIVMAKPELLRVVGTYFGVRIFDMASNGRTFKLYIPSKSLAFEGSNAATEKSKNPLYNLRPGFFFDAMVVRGLDPDDLYSVTADTETIEDVKKKHLLLVPEYILNVMRKRPGTQELAPIRVVTFHRDDLLPYEQDLYDEKGNLVTQVNYANYNDFGSGLFPARVVIKRPEEGIAITLDVLRVTKNPKFPPDEFQVKIPGGTKIETLK